MSLSRPLPAGGRAAEAAGAEQPRRSGTGEARRRCHRACLSRSLSCERFRSIDHPYDALRPQSGKPYQVTIWFVVLDGCVWIGSLKRSSWRATHARQRRSDLAPERP
jgi:hypothetical protein